MGNRLVPTQTAKDVNRRNSHNCENRVFDLKNTYSGGAKAQNAENGILAFLREAGNKRDTRFCTKMSLFDPKTDI